ncbi:MAG TPA: hypothetical protein VFS63_15725 [Pseudolabrys sp.]|jgi:hypothetical protein|nr:hypothetical protein [Pseudolabrys sp.]
MSGAVLLHRRLELVANNLLMAKSHLMVHRISRLSVIGAAAFELFTLSVSALFLRMAGTEIEVMRFAGRGESCLAEEPHFIGIFRLFLLEPAPTRAHGQE